MGGGWAHRVRLRRKWVGKGIVGVALAAGAALQGGAAGAATASVPSTIISSAITSHPEVALTFDDGPSLYTLQVLSILRAFHAHATFFVVGRRVSPLAASVRQAIADGNEVGNHTYTHADLQLWSSGEVAAQLRSTQAAIHAATGITPVWFRPPYGAVDGRVAGIAGSLGLRTAKWSVDPRDWSRPGSSLIIARVVANARPGSIVVMHDGGGPRNETVTALPAILTDLRSRGFRFVTLSELFRLSEPPLCHADETAHQFSHDRIPAYRDHAIYRSWGEQLCNGINLGPATSPEYAIRPGVIVQDFAHTGHRLVWKRDSNAVDERVVWPWAISAFAAHGIQPRWDLALTHMWFHEFFGDRSWGAALQPPVVHGDTIMQMFQYGRAESHHGKVTFIAAGH